MSERDRLQEHRMDHGVVKALITERGQLYTHHECQARLEAAVRGVMRWFSRSTKTMTEWNDADMREHEVRDLRWVLDDLAGYVEIAQRELDRVEGADRRAERVKRLREVAGRTPEEAALYLAKAEALERSA